MSRLPTIVVAFARKREAGVKLEGIVTHRRVAPIAYCRLKGVHKPEFDDLIH